MSNIIQFKKINFFNCNFNYIFKILTLKGGYLVAPAASSVADIDRYKIYRESLENSTIAILDSGFLCLLIRYFWRIKIKKLSGYLFLSSLLKKTEIKKKKFFLVNPNKFENDMNSKYLRSRGLINFSNYIAPKYNFSNYKDKILLRKILSFNPKYIILNIGGGIQEPLGYFLHKNLKNKKICIICTGAAIGFLTKVQATISKFYDEFYLGWLIRLIHRTRNYLPRVIKTLKLLTHF